MGGGGKREVMYLSLYCHQQNTGRRGGGGYGGGGKREVMYLSLCCHQQNTGRRGGGGGYGGGGGKREVMYLSLYCHQQNDSCIKMCMDESHFNILLTRRDKVTRQCPH